MANEYIIGSHAGSTSRQERAEVRFTSIESFAKVLSERNRGLLALIAREEPASLTELAGLRGEAPAAGSPSP